MVKMFLAWRRKAISYFRNHVEYNALVHVLGGIGLGILIASPLAFPHPLRWGLIFLGASLAGHLYTLTIKK